MSIPMRIDSEDLWLDLFKRTPTTSASNSSTTHTSIITLVPAGNGTSNTTSGSSNSTTSDSGSSTASSGLPSWAITAVLVGAGVLAVSSLVCCIIRMVRCFRAVTTCCGLCGGDKRKRNKDRKNNDDNDRENRKDKKEGERVLSRMIELQEQMLLQSQQSSQLLNMSLSASMGPGQSHGRMPSSSALEATLVQYPQQPNGAPGTGRKFVTVSSSASAMQAYESLRGNAHIPTSTVHHQPLPTRGSARECFDTNGGLNNSGRLNTSEGLNASISRMHSNDLSLSRSNRSTSPLRPTGDMSKSLRSKKSTLGL